MRGRSLPYLLICSLAIGCGSGSDETGTGGSTGSAGTTGTGGGGDGWHRRRGDGWHGRRRDGWHRRQRHGWHRRRRDGWHWRQRHGWHGGGATAGTGGGATAGTGGGATAGTGGSATAGTGGATAGTGGRGGTGGGSGGRGGTTGTGGGTAGTGGGGGSGAFILTSPTHAEGAKFAGKFTCNGGALRDGVNPELHWSGVPAGTMSFAMTFIDTTLGETSPHGPALGHLEHPVGCRHRQGEHVPGGVADDVDRRSREREAKRKVLPTLRAVVGEQHGRQSTRSPSTRFRPRRSNITGTSVANALTALRAASAARNGEVDGTRRPQRPVIAPRQRFERRKHNGKAEVISA